MFCAHSQSAGGEDDKVGEKGGVDVREAERDESKAAKQQSAKFPEIEKKRGDLGARAEKKRSSRDRDNGLRGR